MLKVAVREGTVLEVGTRKRTTHKAEIRKGTVVTADGRELRTTPREMGLQ